MYKISTIKYLIIEYLIIEYLEEICKAFIVNNLFHNL